MVWFSLKLFFVLQELKCFMPKIILDCDLMRHPNSGLYHYCLNLGNEVEQVMRASYPDMTIRYYVPPAEKEAFARSKNCIVEGNRFFNRIFRPLLLDCDVWHAPFQSGRILPQPGGKTKILLTIHDLNVLHEGKPEKEQRQSLAHTQALINKADALVCISEFTKSDVLQHCDTGNKPIHVIHNGVHKVHTGIADASAKKSSRPFLFGMGYVNRKKNYHVLLPLLKYNPGIDLVIAGRLDEPDYVEAIKKQAEVLNIADRVHLTGPVSEGAKAWYLSNCMAFVHPSLAEGFGAPVAEAMLFGKPLFLSDRTSLPEIGADAAFYFRSFDEAAMQQVFAAGMQAFEAGNMKEKVMQRGRLFNWKENAARYADVYRSLL